jgi:hypothetical protein
MKTLLSGLMAAALAASFAVPLPMTAQAAPIYVPKVEQQGGTDIQKVNHTYRHWQRQQRRAERRAYRQWRREAWRDSYYGEPYRYSNRRAFRAYRDYDPYYRQYRRPGVTLEFNLGR